MVPARDKPQLLPRLSWGLDAISFVTWRALSIDRGCSWSSREERQVHHGPAGRADGEAPAAAARGGPEPPARHGRRTDGRAGGRAGQECAAGMAMGHVTGHGGHSRAALSLDGKASCVLAWFGMSQAAFPVWVVPCALLCHLLI